jgi:hypothetical protein
MTIVFMTALLWVLRGYVWPTLSNVEVAPLQAQLDPRLFRNDFVVQESIRFSPRFYYNEVILIVSRLGLPLAWSFAMWHVVALTALVTAVRSISNTLRLHAVTSAVLMVRTQTLNVGVLGGVFFNTHAPDPTEWAGTLEM